MGKVCENLSGVSVGDALELTQTRLRAQTVHQESEAAWCCEGELSLVSGRTLG